MCYELSFNIDCSKRSRLLHDCHKFRYPSSQAESVCQSQNDDALTKTPRTLFFLVASLKDVVS